MLGLRDRRLKNVEAPSTCIVSILPGNPVLRVATRFGPPFPLYPLVGSLRATAANVKCLELLFNPDEADILEIIVNANPNVGRLCLVENDKVDSRRGNRSRRAWNDRNDWARQLSKLPKLEIFSLKTRSPILQTRDSEDGKLINDKLINEWMETRVKGMPLWRTSELFSINVWQVGGPASRDVLLCWGREFGSQDWKVDSWYAPGREDLFWLRP